MTASVISPSKRLLVSIHDVGPGSARAVDDLVEILEKKIGSARFAMLVVPNHWGESPLSDDKAYQRRLRDWAEAGVEMFVHGWYHRDASVHTGRRAQFKARHMTAGEGEFLGLDEAEAMRLMRDGKALIEDAIGRASAGFIAPAWLYGPGARAALAKCDFDLAEDHWRVWDARTGRTLVKGPVLTWASRSTMRTASSLAFASLARKALPRLSTIRLAVHPGDITKPSLVASIERSIEQFVHTHTPSRYADIKA